MPKSSTTGAATTRAHTADPAAATSTAADISAAATGAATSATAISAAHAAEQTGSAMTGRHSSGHTASPDPTLMTANQPSALGHPWSPDQAAPAMTESADDRDPDDRNVDERDADDRNVDERDADDRNLDERGAETGRAAKGATGDAVPDRVWTALLAHPASTPAELATAADAGRSTVSKLLAGWAAAGRVTSAAGGTARTARR
jgi:hypothetical protein